ncbi:MAG: fluoride efflux transporter CrcB [Aureliella sp.]
MREINVMQFVLLFLVGGLGCLARYVASGLVQRLYGGELPLGTFVVNVVGCLLFGFVWTLADERMLITSQTRTVILTGFMGSFTTFSTFAFESNALLHDAEWAVASANVVGHVVVGVLAIMLGMAVGRQI